MSKAGIIGPAVSYVDILDVKTYEAAEAAEKEIQNGRPPYNPLRPSSAGKSARELAFALMEYTGQAYYPKSIKDPEVTRLLSLGHYVEDSIVSQFEQHLKGIIEVKYKQQSVYGFSVKSKKFQQLSGLIEGSIDACFITPDGCKGIVDYKSKKDKFSRFFKTNWDETDEKLSNMKTVQTFKDSDKAYWIEELEAFLEELKDPFFENNFWQLNFYCNTVWAKDKGIDHGAIIQYNKNDSRIREVRFKPSASLYQKTAEKFQAAVDACDAGDPYMLPCECKFGSIKCAFCPYAEPCWGDKKDKSALQAYFDTFPKKSWPKDVERLNSKKATTFNSLYKQFLKGQEGAGLAKEAEAEILNMMLEDGIKKIRFEDGKIYEAKLLKSPREHFELRRTKL